jgi:hypothetical protein
MKNPLDLIKETKEKITKEDWLLERKLFKENSEVVSDTQRRNQSNIDAWLPVWFRHYRENLPVITEDFNQSDRNASSSPLPPWVERTDVAICCASGPSLNRIKPYIKDWKGLVICGPTNASLPAAHGRWPDYIVAVDANIETTIPVKRVQWSKHVNFVLPPLIHPEVVKACGDQRYWYVSRIQGDPRNPGKHHFNEYTHYLFGDIIKSYMLQAGCVGNQAIILCQMFNFIKRFNIEKIFLCGFDFAYVNEVFKCDGYTQPANRNYEWVEHKPGPIRTRANMRRSEHGLLTDRSMLGYKRSLYTMWYSLNCGEGAGRLNLYSLSEGILDEIPRPYGAEPLEKQIEKVFTTHGKGVVPYSLAYIKKSFANYLDRTRTSEQEQEILNSFMNEAIVPDWVDHLEAKNLGFSYDHVLEAGVL